MYCVLLATALTVVATEYSPQNVLTCDLANWVRKLYTSLTELRNMRDTCSVITEAT